jgi:hypothetical protein
MIRSQPENNGNRFLSTSHPIKNELAAGHSIEHPGGVSHIAQ